MKLIKLTAIKANNLRNFVSFFFTSQKKENIRYKARVKLKVGKENIDKVTENRRYEHEREDIVARHGGWVLCCQSRTP